MALVLKEVKRIQYLNEEQLCKNLYRFKQILKGEKSLEVINEYKRKISAHQLGLKRIKRLPWLQI